MHLTRITIDPTLTAPCASLAPANFHADALSVMGERADISSEEGATKRIVRHSYAHGWDVGGGGGGGGGGLPVTKCGMICKGLALAIAGILFQWWEGGSKLCMKGFLPGAEEPLICSREYARSEPSRDIMNLRVPSRLKRALLRLEKFPLRLNHLMYERII